MTHAVVHLSVVPVRAEPSDRSEMTSQLLFGDTCEILEKREKWVRIRSHHDRYEGWINPRQTLPINISDYEQYNASSRHALNDTIALAECNGAVQLLSMGSTLPFYSNNTFRLGEKIFNLHGSVVDTTEAHVDESTIQTTALRLLNAPYLWGGRCAMGIDCSGFTQVVFKLLGISLKRDAYQQAEQGRIVNLLDQSQCGDMAFFHNEAGKIVHVGILLDNKTIVHASGCVRIDRIDHQGIFNVERKAYTHQLKLIRRLV